MRETGATTRTPSRNQSLEAIAAAVAPVGDMRMIGLLLFLAAVTVAAGGALAATAALTTRYELDGCHRMDEGRTSALAIRKSLPLTAAWRSLLPVPNGTGPRAGSSPSRCPCV